MNLPGSIKNEKLRRAYLEGENWARSFYPLTKIGEFSDFFDHDSDRVMRALKMDDSGTNVVSLKDYMRPDRETKELEVIRHKTNQAANNVYVHGSLRVWKKNNVKYARRIEIQDDKICGLCLVKNGELYEVNELLEKDLPLTFDTHPNCRGAFMPVIGHITKRDDHKPSDEHVVTLTVGNAVIEDLPIEYKPFMLPFIRRIGHIPFKIKFDKSATFDYKMAGKTLTINPRSSDNDDPRETIARCVARKLWPKMEKQFKGEYGVLLKLGLVHPNRSAQTWPELFENTYKEFKLNQLDEPYEVLWCRSNLAA